MGHSTKFIAHALKPLRVGDLGSMSGAKWPKITRIVANPLFGARAAENFLPGQIEKAVRPIAARLGATAPV